MKFYSDVETNLTVWDGKKGLTFLNGVYETDKKEEIDFLKEKGYRSDDVGETEQGDTERQTTKGEQAKKPKK